MTFVEVPKSVHSLKNMIVFLSPTSQLAITIHYLHHTIFEIWVVTINILKTYTTIFLGAWRIVQRETTVHSAYCPKHDLVPMDSCLVGTGSLSRWTHTLFTPALKGDRSSYLSIQKMKVWVLKSWTPSMQLFFICQRRFLSIYFMCLLKFQNVTMWCVSKSLLQVDLLDTMKN